ncbi:MAG: serine--tRNA ligase [Alphaproteobacteria bacterium]|nr:serine--tRNA ligase [Alphaproteobacteria bacterium]MCS5597541.1 serine--tRNA ligase [Alphaproteobacteria bacterium]|tara:strand:+ start:275 stop:1588 length:1314 start_codon:yes stop_codon:yes gene_type:complete
MFDIKAIRKEPEFFDRAWARRGLEAQTPQILALDTEWRDGQTKLQTLQQKRNELSKEIGKIKSQGGDADSIMAEVAGIKDEMAALEERASILADEINVMLSCLPNILDEAVPEGADEDDNVEVHKWGTPRDVGANDFPDHVAIGENLGMIDFETAAKISGSRFVMLHSGIARLERALAQFMLDTHVQEHGCIEVSPPLLVRDDAMYGTGQLPKFGEDSFRTEQGHWLIATSEISLTNIVADMIVDEADLPRRYTAFTPCFRSEAGAAGKDTRGMLRQHQFYKVEMVSVTTPEESWAEHARMTECAENILKKLELPFRTVVLCAGDTGGTAMKTHDLEVWLPGQQLYREISSVSNTGDFQARRMKARCRKANERETRFVHTLNGSGVAVGRALIAVVENYYDAQDGGVWVPEVLKPYMGGIEKILPANGEVQKLVKAG